MTTSAHYSGATCLINVNGTPVAGKLLHYASCLGSTPSEFTVLLMFNNAIPGSVGIPDFIGKPCTLTINSVLECTGAIVDFSQFDDDNEMGIVISVVDVRHKINAFYVGQNHLEALDTDSSSATYGTAATPTNGLAFYGADITFNFNGLPNKSKTSLDFVPMGFEHNTGNADYWTFGQALEWMWTNCIIPTSGVAMPTVAAATPKDWTFGGMDKKIATLG